VRSNYAPRVIPAVEAHRDAFKCLAPLSCPCPICEVDKDDCCEECYTPTCPICLEGFDRHERKPTTLPCGHSLCFAHMPWIHRCPICREYLPSCSPKLSHGMMAMESVLAELLNQREKEMEVESLKKFYIQSRCNSRKFRKFCSKISGKRGFFSGKPQASIEERCLTAITCPQCQKLYDDNENRRPHTLACGHSTCMSCASTGHIRCYICKTQQPVSSHVRPSYAMVTMIKGVEKALHEKDAETSLHQMDDDDDINIEFDAIYPPAEKGAGKGEGVHLWKERFALQVQAQMSSLAEMHGEHGGWTTDAANAYTRTSFRPRCRYRFLRLICS